MHFTEIQISGLREGIHTFRFALDSRFSAAFSEEFFHNPKLDVVVNLNLSETMIQAQLEISGTVELICDRSMDHYSNSIQEKLTHFYKYGEEEAELSDEMEIISPERVHLNLDQLIYDTIALSIPQKKLHPRFRENEESEDGSIEGALVYSTENQSDQEENERDNRWDILKNLN